MLLQNFLPFNRKMQAEVFIKTNCNYDETDVLNISGRPSHDFLPLFVRSAKNEKVRFE